MRMDLGLIMGDTRSIGYHAIDLPKEIVSLTRIIPSLLADHEPVTYYCVFDNVRIISCLLSYNL